MSLATFEDADLSDPAQLQAFVMAEQLEHHLLAQAALGERLLVSVYPTSDQNMQEFLHLNYRMHQELCDALGLEQPPELEEWDLNDPDQAQQFLQVEMADHVRLATAYGVV